MESKERISPPVKEEPLVRPATPEVPIPREIAGWIEKVERKDTVLSTPVTDDQGQVLVTSSQAQKPKIVLPLEKTDFVLGLKKGVENAIRWLAEWCLRLIKMRPEEVDFKMPSLPKEI